ILSARKLLRESNLYHAGEQAAADQHLARRSLSHRQTDRKKSRIRETIFCGGLYSPQWLSRLRKNWNRKLDLLVRSTGQIQWYTGGAISFARGVNARSNVDGGLLDPTTKTCHFLAYSSHCGSACERNSTRSLIAPMFRPIDSPVTVISMMSFDLVSDAGSCGTAISIVAASFSPGLTE